MRTSGIGGMAVIEGVMMKNKKEYAIAVRKPDNEIAVEKKTYKDFSDKVKLFKLPIFRGMLAFIDSLVIGIKVLDYSASFFDDEEEQDTEKKKDKKTSDIKKNKKSAKAVHDEEKVFKVEEVSITDKKTGKKESSERTNAFMTAAAVLVSLIISITFFMILPVLVSNLFSKFIKSDFWLAVLEGVLRLGIFIGYILVVSQMKEIKRVFMYHGAEHKTINCIENGFELNVENVRWQSRQNKRCGTSFMLFVMLISLIFFIILQPKTLLWKILSRVLLIPIISGISYEFIRLAGRSDNAVVNVISKPGLWLQSLTTKEPDDSMIEVAIQSVNAVFDWKGFLEAAPTTEKGTLSLKKNNKASGKAEKSAAGIEKEQPKKAAPVQTNKEQSKKAAPVQTNKEQPKKAAPAQTNKEQPKKAVPVQINKEQSKKNAEPQKKGTAQNSKSGRNLNQSSKENEAAPAAGVKRAEEDDDEILKALDKYLDCGDGKETK